MSARTKFRKIAVGKPDGPITRKNSLAGLVVISDYIDPLSSERTLVLERIEHAASVEVPAKRKVTRKRKTNATGAQTAFEHGAGAPAATV